MVADGTLNRCRRPAGTIRANAAYGGGVRTAFGQDFDLAGPYLNTPSVGVPPLAVADAVAAAVRDWQRGGTQPQDFDASVGAARDAFATLVGVPAGSVAIGGSVSALLALVAAGVRDGARVLTATGEFTSLTFPFAAQHDRGVSVTEVDLDDVPDRAGDHDVVAVSVVQSADGRVVDLERLRAATEGSRTLVVLDVTQAAGWLPLRLGWTGVVVGGAYKWLLAPRGAAWMAVHDDVVRTLRPLAANWYAGDDPWQSIYGLPLRLAPDARRLDASPAWFSHLGAGLALPWLATLDLAAVRDHCVGLANALRAHLDLPPAGSAIVSVPLSGAAERLAAAGVVASVRGGAARVGFHLYNNADDLDCAAAALRPSR